MASLQSINLLMITFFFLLLHSPSSTTATATLNDNNNDAKAPSKLVKTVCKQTKINGDCFAALAIDPRALSETHPKTLAKIALQLAVTNTTKSKEFIEAMAKNESSSPPLKSALEYCVVQYQSTVNSFSSSLAEVDDDPMTANYDALVASDGANYCEKELGSDKGASASSVRIRNKYVTIYSRIGYIITDMLD